jgi:sortase A
VGRRQRYRIGAAALGSLCSVLVVVIGVGLMGGRSEMAPTVAVPATVAEPSPVPILTSTTSGPTSTTTTTAAVTTTTGPQLRLPVPADLPDDPYADTPDDVVATISIPALGLDAAVHTGMTLTAINRGPSWWPGTALPGQLGNVVIGGHRTTYSRPFHDLDQLQPGDPVVMTTGSGRYTYVVVKTEVVEPTAVEIADQTLDYTATLFACHPPGSAAYRIVAKLQLVDGSGQPVPGPVGYTIANPGEIIHYRR